MSSLEKRTWHYAQPPALFAIAPCDCGNEQTQWSEFVGHLWCEKCEKDFVPAHGGIFDGPIPVELTAALGISFDRVDIATQTLERFSSSTGEYTADSKLAGKVTVVPLSAGS